MIILCERTGERKVKAIICLGADNRKLHEAFGNDVELLINTTNAVDAVQSAFHIASKGDVVLLSPPVPASIYLKIMKTGATSLSRL